MLDLFNIAKPQGCDIQTFYGNGAVSSTANTKSWNKPRGVSNVYMLLIGPGADGSYANTTGGGSGSVTVWYGSAQNVPDQLDVWVGASGNATQIKYRTNSASSPITLLTALGGSTGTGGTATAAGVFAASGFYQSIAGQNGTGGDVAVSTTTFLSGGAFTSTNRVQSNYGYGISLTATDKNGYFIMQPIIVGSGGKDGGVGGIGCGGGAGSPINGLGGPGMVLIASW